MAEKDSDGPSLELPSFGLGRARRPRRGQAEPPPGAQAQPQPDTHAEPPPEVQAEPPTAPIATDRERPAPQPEATDAEERPRREFSLPAIGGLPASVLVGLVAGLLTVAMIWASLRLCELVRGTSSCGDPGFFLLLAAVLLTGLVSAALLRALAVPDPGSTSALGIGLATVVVLLFLGGHLFAWWMVIALPAAAMATFAFAHWLTTTFGDARDDTLHR